MEGEGGGESRTRTEETSPPVGWGFRTLKHPPRWGIACKPTGAVTLGASVRGHDGAQASAGLAEEGRCARAFARHTARRMIRVACESR